MSEYVKDYRFVPFQKSYKKMKKRNKRAEKAREALKKAQKESDAWKLQQLLLNAKSRKQR